MPHEYLTLYLCRDVYHCAPDVLNRQKLADLLPHLTALEIEGQVEKARSKM